MSCARRTWYPPDALLGFVGLRGLFEENLRCRGSRRDVGNQRRFEGESWNHTGTIAQFFALLFLQFTWGETSVWNGTRAVLHH